MLAQAASVASRYAFGADGVGAARPGACGEADRRLALRAQRSALRAQRRSPICVLHTRAYLLTACTLDVSVPRLAGFPLN